MLLIRVAKSSMMGNVLNAQLAGFLVFPDIVSPSMIYAASGIPIPANVQPVIRDIVLRREPAYRTSCQQLAQSMYSAQIGMVEIV